jgi:hypothetical protein
MRAYKSRRCCFCLSIFDLASARLISGVNESSTGGIISSWGGVGRHETVDEALGGAGGDGGGGSSLTGVDVADCTGCSDGGAGGGGAGNGSAGLIFLRC